MKINPKKILEAFQNLQKSAVFDILAWTNFTLEMKIININSQKKNLKIYFQNIHKSKVFNLNHIF